MRAVIDTCVILDYLQCREPFFDDALNIAIGRANNEFEAYITASSLTDLYYIIHRHTHSSIETRRIISDLTVLFGLIDTYAEDCINALHSEMKDYEDSVMSETAYRIKADCIVTRNIKDYERSRVPAVLPSEFLMNTEKV
ncbi:MAG: PIN domain-containing protein [Mogibacterium sp.]|jgi:predicted nucleic acid-binding protein|nr:PIN domain-containing protein [Mogibacterium sp.]MBR3376542.1 PIN domain-containing protein [Mogibacterium sp.]